MFVFFTCIPLFVTIYTICNYYDYEKYSTNKTIKLKEKIDNIQKDINVEKERIEEIKTVQEEKVGILELWKKRLEKIR